MSAERSAEKAQESSTSSSTLTSRPTMTRRTALSEWKGYDLDGAFADEERWESGTDRGTKWLGLAQEVGIGGRSMSSIDGWADFPDATVARVGWPDFSIDYVQELDRG